MRGITVSSVQRFLGNVFRSAVTMTAATYTSRGMQKGIEYAVDKIRGSDTKETDDEKVDQATDVTPKFN